MPPVLTRRIVVDAILPLLVGIFPIDDLRDSFRMRFMTPFRMRSTRSTSVFGFQESSLVKPKKIRSSAITINISTIVKPDFEARDCLFITNFYYLDQIVYIFFISQNMKSIFALFVLFFSVALTGFIASVTAAILPPDVMIGGGINVTSASTSTASVFVVSVKALDELHARATFSDDMDISSVRAKLTKQSDSSVIRVVSLTGVTDVPNAVDITLATPIQEGSAYVLTIVSGVSTDGRAIRDGALAIKDFITPVPLKKAELVLNAPPNPNAVTSSSAITGTTTVPPKTTVAPVVPPKNGTGGVASVAITKELPLTGMNPFLLILFAFAVTYFFVRKKA